MSLTSHAYKRLCKLYRGVLNRMRVLEWLGEHGRVWGSDRTQTSLATIDAFEPRLYMSRAAAGVSWSELDGVDPQTALTSDHVGWLLYDDVNNNQLCDAGEPFGVATKEWVFTLSGQMPTTYKLRNVYEAGSPSSILQHEADAVRLATWQTEQAFVEATAQVMSEPAILLGDELEVCSGGSGPAPQVVGPMGRDEVHPNVLNWLSFEFSQDVSDSLQLADLSVYNRTTQSAATLGNASLDSSLGKWSFTAMVPGQYVAFLSDAGVYALDAEDNHIHLDGDGDGEAGGDHRAEFIVPRTGDASVDGRVNDDDLSLVLANWHLGTTWHQGEFTGDGDVEDNDLSLVLSNFGSSVLGPANAVPAVTSLSITNGAPPNANDVTLSAIFADSSPTDVHSATIIWGDGGIDFIDGIAAGVTTLSMEHSYEVSGEYQGTLILGDGVNAETKMPFVVHVDVTAENTAPLILSASPTASPVTGTSTVLTAVAFDDGGPQNLTYTWSVNDPAGAELGSQNGTNAARALPVTFFRAGSHVFHVVATDAESLESQSFELVVTVAQTTANLRVVPSSTVVHPGRSKQLSFTGTDQFGHALLGVQWGIQGEGTITSEGLYTAPNVLYATAANICVQHGDRKAYGNIDVATMLPLVSGPSEVVAGQSYAFTFVAFQIDEDTPLQSWTIQWRDGSPDETVDLNEVVPNEYGMLSVSVQHVFQNTGTCGIRSTVTDEYGFEYQTHLVAIAAPTVTFAAAPTSEHLKCRLELSPQAPASGPLLATIKWGDGRQENATWDTGTSFLHAYDAPGDYDISVFVDDGQRTYAAIAAGAAQSGVVRYTCATPPQHEQRALTAGDAGVLAVLGGTDDEAVQIDLPAGKLAHLYGNSYSRLFVSTNGLISFDRPDGAVGGTWTLDSLGQPAVAVLWGDWSCTGSDSQVLYAFKASHGSGVDELVIQWNEVVNGEGATATFQAIVPIGTAAASMPIVMTCLSSTGSAALVSGIANPQQGDECIVNGPFSPGRQVFLLPGDSGTFQAQYQSTLSFTATPDALDEGDECTVTYTCAGQFDYILVDWGDGTTATYEPEEPIKHRYTVEGIRDITAMSVVDGVVTASASQTVTVQNVPFEIDSLRCWGDMLINQDIGVEVVFVDSGRCGDDVTYHWTVTTEADPTTVLAEGDEQSLLFSVVDAGSYDITVYVDDGHGPVSATHRLSVVAASPVTVSASSSAIEGESYEVQCSVSGTTLSSWIITWNDGTADTPVNLTGQTVTHTFASGPAVHYVQAVAVDSNGLKTYSTIIRVSVADRIPQPHIVVDQTQIESGASCTLQLDAAYPAGCTDTLLNWVINWGDGQVQTVDGSATSCSHTYSLHGDETLGSFEITATAVDAEGSYAANTQSVTVAWEVPDAVSELAATKVAGGVHLTWVFAQSGSASFNVYRGDSIGNMSLVGSTGDLFYDDSEPLTAGQCYYQIRAVVDGREGLPGEVIEVVADAPEEPANLTATAEDQSVTLQWEGNSAALAYQIYRSTSDEVCPLTPLAIVAVESLPSGLSWIDEAVEYGHTYTYWMRALGHAGESSLSDPATATIEPAIPVIITAEVQVHPGELGQPDSYQVLIEWTASYGATSYQIIRRGSGPEVVFDAVTWAYVDALVTAGQRCTYSVVAVNSGGVSEASEPVEVSVPQTPAQAGQVMSLTVLARTKPGYIELNWSVYTDAEGYEIERRPAGGPWIALATVIDAYYRDEWIEPADWTGQAVRYEYRITPVEGAEEVPEASGTATVWTAGAFGEEVQVLPWAASVGAMRVEVSWLSPVNPTDATPQYTVYRSENNNPGDLGTEIVGTLQVYDGRIRLIDTSCTPGEQYYYTVLATYCGVEAQSPKARVATPLPPQVQDAMTIGSYESLEVWRDGAPTNRSVIVFFVAHYPRRWDAEHQEWIIEIGGVAWDYALEDAYQIHYKKVGKTEYTSLELVATPDPTVNAWHPIHTWDSNHGFAVVPSTLLEEGEYLQTHEVPVTAVTEFTVTLFNEAGPGTTQEATLTAWNLPQASVLAVDHANVGAFNSSAHEPASASSPNYNTVLTELMRSESSPPAGMPCYTFDCGGSGVIVSANKGLQQGDWLVFPPSITMWGGAIQSGKEHQMNQPLWDPWIEFTYCGPVGGLPVEVTAWRVVGGQDTCVGKVLIYPVVGPNLLVSEPVYANTWDLDCDGVIDYADGFDFDRLSGSVTGESDNIIASVEARFTPLRLELPSWLVAADSKVCFVDSEGMDSEISVTRALGGLPGTWTYSAGDGSFRVWRKDAGEERSREDLIGEGSRDTGQFQWVDLSSLQLDETGAVTVYIEGINSGCGSLTALFWCEGGPGGTCILSADCDFAIEVGPCVAADQVSVLHVAANIADDDNDGIIDWADWEIGEQSGSPGFGQCTTTIPAGWNASDIEVVVTYPGSNPLSVTMSDGCDGSIDRPFVYVADPDGGRVRVWTKGKWAQRNGCNVADGGDYVAAGPALPAVDMGLEQGQNLVLYIEGLSVGSETITIQLHNISNGLTYIHKVRVDVAKGDLIIDSDNNDGIDVPEYSNATEQIEGNDSETDVDVANDIVRPGKIIPANDGDVDGDAIVDNLDGYNADGIPGNADDEIESDVQLTSFVPVVLDLAGLDFNKVSIQLCYPGSVPGIELGLGTLRIWSSVDGELGSRTGKAVGELSDLVFDADKSYYLPADTALGPKTLRQLGFGVDGSTSVVLWVEAVRPSESVADQAIELHVDLGRGDGFQLWDVVRLTAGAGDLDIDSDNNNSDLPSRSEREEHLEDSPSGPGKIILLNTADLDENGTPDFADSQGRKQKLVPIMFEMPAWFDTTQDMTVSFDFEESVFDQTTSVGADNKGYAAEDGYIRLWTGETLLSRVEAGTAYLLGELGWTVGMTVVPLYVEAVRATPLGVTTAIEMKINPKGDANLNAAFTADTVNLTLIDAVRDDSRHGTVRLFDGSVDYSETHLRSSGFNGLWTHSLRFTSSSVRAGTGEAGSFDIDLPFAIECTSGVCIYINGQTRYFDRLADEGSGESFRERFDGRGVLSTNAVGGQLELQEPDGSVWLFHGEQGSALWGRFKEYCGPAFQPGSTLDVVTAVYQEDGRLAYVERVESPYRERFVYGYHPNGEFEGLLKSVTLKRQHAVAADNAEWRIVESVQYSYYGEGSPFGQHGDLMLTERVNALEKAVGSTQYRYDAPAGEGQPSRLKMVLGEDGWARLKGLGKDPLAATDKEVAAHAEVILKYDGARVKSQAVRGTGGQSEDKGTAAVQTYEYVTNEASGRAVGSNTWYAKTITKRPGVADHVEYYNSSGQVMMAIDQSGNTRFASFNGYNADGKLVLSTDSGAIDLGSMAESTSDLLGKSGGNYAGLHDYRGAVTRYVYHDGSGYLESQSIAHGESGQEFVQNCTVYVPYALPELTVWMTQRVTVYSGTTSIVTNYSYAEPAQWYGYQPRWMKTTLPDGGEVQNVFDAHGRVISSIADHTETWFYDPCTGNTMVHSVGGHIKEIYLYDDLGRPKLIMSPNGTMSLAPSAWWTYSETSEYSDVLMKPLVGPAVLTRHDKRRGEIYTITLPCGDYDRSPDKSKLQNVDFLSVQREVLDYGGRTIYSDRFVTTELADDLGDFFDGRAKNVNTVIDPSKPCFYRTAYRYNEAGIQNYVVNGVNTATLTTFDQFGRALDTSIGVANGSYNGTAMATVLTNDYGADYNGVGNVSRSTVHPDGDSSHDRVTDYFYDWQGRLVAAHAAPGKTDVAPPISFMEYDAVGNVTGQGVYDGTGYTISRIVEEGGTDADGVPDAPPNDRLRSQTKSTYNAGGKVDTVEIHSIAPVYNTAGAITGVTADPNLKLLARYVYDEWGRTQEVESTGQPTKTVTYDSAGRVETQSFWSEESTGRHEMERTEYAYDAADNVIFVKTFQRHHDATDKPLTSANARISYQAMYYDSANRIVKSVDLGTYGGAQLASRPASSTFINRSFSGGNQFLMTEYEYDAAGSLSKVTDPRGVVTYRDYDSLGRVSNLIEAYTKKDGAYVPQTDCNRMVEYKYDGVDHVVEQIQCLTEGRQRRTSYSYGVKSPMGSTCHMGNNDLLESVSYPIDDKGSVGQAESYVYNALGELIEKIVESRPDTPGVSGINVKHQYKYDSLGRQTEDKAVISDSTVDAGIVKLVTVYDSFGRPQRFQSLNAAGNIVNEVFRKYDGFGQIAAEYQSHSGSVIVNDALAALSVTYTYSTNVSSPGRLEKVTYPKLNETAAAREVHYLYDTEGSGLYRPSAIGDSATQKVEEYGYLGLSTVVDRRVTLDASAGKRMALSYALPAGTLNTISDGGDKYNGLDRFGRVVDQFWYWADSAWNRTGNIERFQYGYDAAGNRLYKKNHLNASMSELYHANGATANTAYDPLGRMTNFRRGSLETSGSSRPDWVYDPSSREQWGMDEQGRWLWHDKQDKDTSDILGKLNRLVNQVIEGAAGTVESSSSRSGMRYDAWHRLLKTTKGSLTTQYQYDALGRMVRADDNAGQVVYKDFYHSKDWQTLQERSSDGSIRENVWSVAYVDAMLYQERFEGGQTKRYFPVQDANFNVTSVIGKNGSGNYDVIERNIYTPYGVATALTANWSRLPASAIGWKYLHQGGYATADGLYHFRNRSYDPRGGQWLQRDPLGYAGGSLNLREYEGSNPASNRDPSGLGINVVSAIAGAIVGGVVGGIAYGIEYATGDAKWDWGRFGVYVGVGAGTGALAGLTFGATLAVTSGKIGTIGGVFTAGTVSGAVGSATNDAALQYSLTGNVNWRQVGHSTLIGAATGGVLSVGGYGLGRAFHAASRSFGSRGVPVSTMSRGAALRAKYGETFAEYSRYRGQGFTPAQAKYLTEPYTGLGHHFPITQSAAGKIGLPTVLRDSPLNVMKPAGISRGAMYERHFMADTHWFGTRFPNAIGGIWSGTKIGLQKPGYLGRLWYASPGPFKAAAGASVAGGAGFCWWLSDDE